MKRLAIAAMALLPVAGCATIYTEPAISDIDDNDLKVMVRSNDPKATLDTMRTSAEVEARRGCERSGKRPDYLSHIVMQKKTGAGAVFAEALTKPAWMPSRANAEWIVQYLFACVD